MTDIAIIILAYNESVHIGRALRSIKGIASEIFVIDSGSKDDTVQIAETNGAKVLYHPFVNQSQQLQWAIDNAPISAKWIMKLDADEIVESDLAQEILRKLPNLPDDVVGVNLNLKRIFMGHWLRHGGLYPLRLLRIWRRGQGRIEQRWMDEHMVVWGGRTITLQGGFSDWNLNNLHFFTEKHNRYATREAIEVINQRLCLFSRDISLNVKNTSWQAAAKRYVKEKIYNRMPFTISSTLYFMWRYIFRLGFLDGRSGLIYHFLQGYWYRFLVGAKIMELESAIAHLTNKQDILSELSRLTGHNLLIQAQSDESKHKATT